MDYITVSAKNLDDAITDALIQLGVTSDQLDYEVIEKGSAGFLGIGFKQAVIKARKKQAQKPIKKETPKVEKVVEASDIIKETKKEQKEVPIKKVEEPAFVKEEKRELEFVEIQKDTIEAVSKFLKDMLATMDMSDVVIKIDVDKDNILCIDMEGENMGILIGKRGQTLDSIQYLANRVANKAQDGYVRVKLDTEDYRKRRQQTLENLARNIASKVKRTRRNVSLEPMNAYERRIIHSYLQNDNQVTTHSEGNEPYRKVVITYVRK
ncbi:MAG: RNA-binding cell elongation regulator Jag/EloR [Suipraeoptans sp.]